MMGKKNIITNDQCQKVKELFDKKIGSRKIAKELGITRWAVQQIYKKLGIYNIGRKNPIVISGRTEYICLNCKKILSIDNFRKRINKKTKRIGHESVCLDCEYFKNEERLKIRAKKLRQTDINFVLRKSVSYSIWKALSINNSSKCGLSCINYLEYTIEELKFNLESKFESWMNWNNYGSYNKKIWNYNDQTTWIWNIDHIIPQSLLPYNSMEDENFKKCWSLNNLRPYSAKKNNIDGVNRLRHKSILIRENITNG